jgi:hypothetical protein
MQQYFIMLHLVPAILSCNKFYINDRFTPIVSNRRVELKQIF